MPIDPYCASRRRENAHAPAPDESDAMQIGRDDWKAFQAIRETVWPWAHIPDLPCPFPQGSDDEREWREGQQRERGGK